MNESNNYALNISTYKVTIFSPYTCNSPPEKIAIFPLALSLYSPPFHLKPEKLWLPPLFTSQIF